MLAIKIYDVFSMQYFLLALSLYFQVSFHKLYISIINIKFIEFYKDGCERLGSDHTNTFLRVPPPLHPLILKTRNIKVPIPI